ncbi:MAG TPA: hypothetical protein VEK07_18950 [Polyangiaceae bacterium]|nr:hypothetical protein [Polyangiaceae bacterium]
MAPTTTSDPDTKSINKSDFIRSQPSSMSAAQVVEKAKAQGMDLRAGLVYEVRRTDRAKKTAGAKPPTAAGKKGAPKSTATVPKSARPEKPATSKAAFVRAHANLTPKEIVERAKAESMELDVGYVYNVRSSSKASKNEGPGRAARRAAEPKGASTAKAASVISRVEILLKAVAAEVGLGRAIELLQSERARIRAAIGD